VPPKTSWLSGLDGARTMGGLTWRHSSRSALSDSATAGPEGSKRSGFTAAGPTRSSQGVASAPSLTSREPPCCPQGPGACTATTAAATHCRRHSSVPTGPATTATTTARPCRSGAWPSGPVRRSAAPADTPFHTPDTTRRRPDSACGAAHDARTQRRTGRRRGARFEDAADHRLVRTGAAARDGAGGGTHVRAVEVQPDALAQFRDGLLGQTGVGARGAGCAQACASSIAVRSALFVLPRTSGCGLDPMAWTPSQRWIRRSASPEPPHLRDRSLGVRARNAVVILHVRVQRARRRDSGRRWRLVPTGRARSHRPTARTPGISADHPYHLVPDRSKPYVYRANERVTINAGFTDNSYKWAGGGYVAAADDLVLLASA
jgi:hypothetical protein